MKTTASGGNGSGELPEVERPVRAEPAVLSVAEPVARHLPTQQFRMIQAAGGVRAIPSNRVEETAESPSPLPE